MSNRACALRNLVKENLVVTEIWCRHSISLQSKKERKYFLHQNIAYTKHSLHWGTLIDLEGEVWWFCLFKKVPQRTNHVVKKSFLILNIWFISGLLSICKGPVANGCFIYFIWNLSLLWVFKNKLPGCLTNTFSWERFWAKKMEGSVRNKMST